MYYNYYVCSIAKEITDILVVLIGGNPECMGPRHESMAGSGYWSMRRIVMVGRPLCPVSDATGHVTGSLPSFLLFPESLYL